MRRAAQLIARLAGQLSRRLGRGGGTTLPGVVLLKLRPRAAEELAQELLTDGALVVSATNGKTTTARLLASAADSADIGTVANTAGSNLLRGVVAALLDAEPDHRLGLFEVDEAALPAVVDQVKPRVIVLMNLFRDQLDRYGELESLVATWRTMIDDLPDGTTLVLNADDPAVAHLGHGRAGVVWFGVDDPSVGRDGLAHAADSTHCPVCDTPLVYDLVTIGHLGHWRCPACHLARPTPDVAAEEIHLRGLDGVDVAIRTPQGRVATSLSLPGVHNAYNAVAAVAGALELGIGVGKIGPALETTEAAFGRGERIELEGRRLFLLLAKNPAGANENIRTALLDPEPLNVMVFLNDRTADGRDVSWIWDVDYEPLFDRLGSVTLSGDRAHDLALRFRYGGHHVDAGAVHPDPSAALDHLLATVPAGETVYLLPTYTAMLDLRAELVRRGVASDYWEARS